MEEEEEEIWGNFDKHLENFSNYLHIYLKVWIGKMFRGGVNIK